MRLTIETKNEAVNASLEGKIPDIVEAIAEVMLSDNQVAAIFQAAVEVYGRYKEKNKD